jgi:hypothetical protein
MKGALALIVMLVALSLTAFAGSAAADPPPTPNGWEGACNMNQSWPGLRQNQHGVGVQDEGGMQHAMGVNQRSNTTGNDGMIAATERTSHANCG